MKGLLVVLCARSQSGKDFIAQKLASEISRDKNNPQTCFATVYKVRPPRATDPDYIRGVSSEDEIHISKQNQIKFKIFSQTIVYDKTEIQKALDEGKIIFISTCSPDAATLLKCEFYEQCNAIFVRSQRPSETSMAKIEYSRKNELFQPWNKEVSPDVLKIIASRQKEQELLHPAYETFMKDPVAGADNIITNLWTLFQGDWNSIIDHKIINEISTQSRHILWIYEHINSDKNTSWRSQPDCCASSEIRKRDSYNLRQDFLEYIDEKRRND